jgi:plastocyanin
MLGLSLAATLVAALAGCGGQATDHGDAIVVPDPTAVTTSTSSPKASGAPAASTPASTSSSSTTGSSPVTAEGWGTLKGHVVFGGDAPTPKVLADKGKAPKDPEVCAKDAPVLSERLVIDGASKGVKNVLVYLSKPTRVNDDAKKAASSAKIMFDQEKCIFAPHVLAIMNGLTITLKSSDPVNHNINAKLKQSPYNQLLAGGLSVPFTPQGTERVPGEVTCDIHPWMKAWWMVVDHPYFAVTDAKGNFEIKNVPAGTQKLVVWQEAVKSGFVTASSGDEVVIKANDSTEKDYTIDPGKILPE